MKKAIIVAGNYGSGKTELSLNMSLWLAKEGRTVLVDMDIVNPYFRSAEHGDLLSEHGVDLIAPTYANSTVDVPVISADVKRAFEYDYAIFDAGGDPVGAAVLGSISEFFNKDNTEFYYVVNARRPLQRSSAEILTMMQQISMRARVPLTGLINNTNLARETTVKDLAFGRDVCLELSEKSGLPVAFSSGEENVLADYKKQFPDDKTFEISIYTRPYWLDITAE